MSSEDETINHLQDKTSTTGEELIIDENSVHEHEHPLSCSRTRTHLISGIKIQTIKMTHKIETIKMKQIIKLHLSTYDCKSL